MSRFIKQLVFCGVAVLIATLSSTNCLASCGDWLADADAPMDKHSNGSSSSAPSLSTSSELKGVQDRSDEDSSQRCHGPECRQAPAIPLQPLARNAIPPVNDAQMREAAEHSATDQRVPATWDLFNEHAIPGHYAALERPPQFAN